MQDEAPPFELEDQPWFPATIRDLATDYLQFIQTRFRLDRAMAPLVRRVLEQSGATRIVDLCSGGSGPLLLLVKDLAAEGLPLRATLTDLYPNAPAFEKIAGASGGLIDYEPEPVDARKVPARLAGLRTIFNGFHHLKPADAQAVLHAAAAARQPIAIFEVSERSLRTLPVVLTPLFVWLATPCMRPVTLAPAALDLSAAARAADLPLGRHRLAVAGLHPGRAPADVRGLRAHDLGGGADSHRKGPRTADLFDRIPP